MYDADNYLQWLTNPNLAPALPHIDILLNMPSLDSKQQGDSLGTAVSATTLCLFTQNMARAM